MIGAVLKDRLERKINQQMNRLIGTTPTILVPNVRIHGKQVEKLLAHKYLAAKGGTVFRNAIRYFHYPVDCHQENVDETPLYASLAHVTAKMVAVDPDELRRRTQHRMAKDLSSLLLPGCPFGIFRLRDILFPLITKLLYELMFDRECSREKARILSDSSQNVLKSAKGLVLPDLAMRRLALDCIREELQTSARGQRFFEGSDLPEEIKSKHMLGVVFHTGSIQTVEFTSHVLLELAKLPEIVSRIRNECLNTVDLDTVLMESLRMFPLTGMTNRIATQDILLENGARIRCGQQVLFDFKKHQDFGYQDADVFMPERWLNIKKADVCYMPFGIGSRKCPAERFAHGLTKELVAGIADRFDILAPVEHSRSLDGGGLCCLVRRSADASDRALLSVIGAYLRVRDAVDQFRFDVLKVINFPRIVQAAQKLTEGDLQQRRFNDPASAEPS